MIYWVTGGKPWCEVVKIPDDWGKIPAFIEPCCCYIGDTFLLPHYSDRVPEEIIASNTCIGFHMTDLPYGRGGNPLQNLIARGRTDTMLTAFRMTDELDAGPVYLKEPLSLYGNAEEIYTRASWLAVAMAQKILQNQMVAVPQDDCLAVPFQRLKPYLNDLGNVDLGGFYPYDIIRMNDADSYERAFLKHSGMKFEFRNAVRRANGAIECLCTITEEE